MKRIAWGCGWYRRSGQTPAHYFIGDGVHRSTAACGAYQFKEPMESSPRYKQCQRCKAVLTARARVGTFPAEYVKP